MTTNEVQQILIRFAAFEATMTEKFDALAAENLSARVHQLEIAKAQGDGAKKQYAPGGWLGAIALVVVTAVVTHYTGR